MFIKQTFFAIFDAPFYFTYNGYRLPNDEAQGRAGLGPMILTIASPIEDIFDGFVELDAEAKETRLHLEVLA
jgi:hypothetical protein